MRLGSTLFAACLLAGCAATAPTSRMSTAAAGAAAFTVDPRPDPTPLPMRSPTLRPNREIEGLASVDLARWALPEHADEIAATEIFPARWGVITYAYLWQAPRPAVLSGLCEVHGWGVGFQIENERQLTPRQSINPPLRPASSVPERRFRVPGSVGAHLTPARWAAAPPYWRWAEAPSAEAMRRAAGLMEQAREHTAGSRSPDFRLSCTRIRTDQPCEDARAFLQQLTPNFVKRVRSSRCEGDISPPSEGDCIAIEYHDPAAPGTFSIYMVRIAGRDTPGAIEIVQGMLPPQ